MSDFFNWLTKKTNESRPEYGDYASLWEASRIKSPEPPNKTEMWQDLRVRLTRKTEQSPVGWFQALFLQRPAFAMAAVVVILLGFWLVNKPTAFSADRGIPQKQIILVDQSTVTLNAASQIVLAPGFNKKNREVFLKGEAYFQVEKGDDPFIIQAGEARVRVVGTRFNVYARENVVRLDVTEGVVEFSTMVGNVSKTITLRAGESSVIAKGNGPEPIKPNDLKGSVPVWINGKIDCTDKPFREVCDEIERRYNIRIRLLDPELAAEPLSGRLDVSTLENALDNLVSPMGSTHRLEGDVYIIE